MPSLIALAKTLHPAGLSLVLINVGEDRRTVERAVRERGYDVPVLLDEWEDGLGAFSVHVTPTVVLLGREGALLGRALGPRSWATAGGRALLEALLACKARG